MRPEKSSLISEKRPGEKFFFHSPPRIIKCVSEYTFLISKTKHAKKKKKWENTKIIRKVNKKRENLWKID